MDKKTYVSGIDYQRIKIRTKKYDDGVLLTNDTGNWVFLTQKEYDNYLFRNIDEELYVKLKENFMILAAENFEGAVHQLNDYYWYLDQGTSLHILIPTLRCNFTCKYCYAYRSPEDAEQKDMTPELIDQSIDFVFKSPSPVYGIEFSGGEPLLRFDLMKRAILRAEELAEKHNKKVGFSVVTNGTYIDDEKITFFLEHKVGICLSLDGPKELHDSHRRITRGDKQSYDLVVEKINLLKERRVNGINAIPVITKDSLELWKEIVDEYVKHGFSVLRFKYVSYFGFASSTWDTMSYEADAFLDAWKNVINYMLELNKKGIVIAENLASIILQKLITGINTNYAEMSIPCGAVIGQVVYDYDGSIYTCDEARTMEEFKIGHVSSSEYKDLLDNPVTKTMQSMSNLTAYNCDQDCPWFSFCGLCPLEIYNQEKGFITNIPSNYRHKIHEGMFEFLMDKILHNEDEKKLLYKWPFLKRGIFSPDEELDNNVTDTEK